MKPKTTDREAIALAIITEDAYSFRRYGRSSWMAVSRALARRGYTKREIEAILRSKWPRFAADWLGNDRALRQPKVAVESLLTWMDEESHVDCEPGSATLRTMMKGTFNVL